MTQYAFRNDATSVRLVVPNNEPVSLLVPAHTTPTSILLMSELVGKYISLSSALIQHMLLNRNTEGLTAFDELDIMAPHLSNTQCFDILNYAHDHVRKSINFETLTPAGVLSTLYGRAIDTMFLEKQVTFGYKSSVKNITFVAAAASAPEVLVPEPVTQPRSVTIADKEIPLGNKLDEENASADELLKEALRLLDLAAIRDPGGIETPAMRFAQVLLNEERGGELINKCLLSGDYDLNILDILKDTEEYKALEAVTIRAVLAHEKSPVKIPTYVATHAKALLAAKGLIDPQTDAVAYLTANKEVFVQIQEELGACIGGRVELDDVISPKNPDREISFKEMVEIVEMYGIGDVNDKQQKGVAPSGASTGAFAGESHVATPVPVVRSKRAKRA